MTVPSSLNTGEEVSFFVYAYHRTQYKTELRVSKIYQITYNFTQKPIHHNITLDFGDTFYEYITGQTLDTSRPQKRLSSQNMGVVRCMNMDYLVDHRKAEMDYFNKMERKIYEVDDFDYKAIYTEKKKLIDDYKTQQKAESAAKSKNQKQSYWGYNPAPSPEIQSLQITEVNYAPLGE